MRAPKACAEVGCLEPSTYRGRCEAHKHPAWGGSGRRDPPGWSAVKKQMRGKPCAACGSPSTEVDHITPVAFGGSHHPSNLQPLCTPCHAKKSQEDAQEGRKRAGGRGPRGKPPGPA